VATNVGDVFGQSISAFGAGFPGAMQKQQQSEIEGYERELEAQQQRFSRASKMFTLATVAREAALKERAETREQYLFDQKQGTYDPRAGSTDEVIARVLESGDPQQVDDLIGTLAQIAQAKASGTATKPGETPPNEIKKFYTDLDKRVQSRAGREQKYLADKDNYRAKSSGVDKSGRPIYVPGEQELVAPFSEPEVDAAGLYKRDYAHFWRGAYGERGSDSLRAQLAVDIPALRTSETDTIQFTQGALAGIGAPGGVPSFNEPQSYAQGRQQSVEAWAKKLPGWKDLSDDDKKDLLKLIGEKVRTLNNGDLR